MSKWTSAYNEDFSWPENKSPTRMDPPRTSTMWKDTFPSALTTEQKERFVSPCDPPFSELARTVKEAEKLDPCQHDCKYQAIARLDPQVKFKCNYLIKSSGVPPKQEDIDCVYKDRMRTTYQEQFCKIPPSSKKHMVTVKGEPLNIQLKTTPSCSPQLTSGQLPGTGQIPGSKHYSSSQRFPDSTYGLSYSNAADPLVAEINTRVRGQPKINTFERMGIIRVLEPTLGVSEYKTSFGEDVLKPLRRTKMKNPKTPVRCKCLPTN